jgi:hypothetical protein
MRAVLCFIKREWTSVILLVLSLFPLLLIGSILDILLTHVYARFENAQASLPHISQWVYENLSGHRALPQEIMVCFWLLMVLCIVFSAFMAKDRIQFRIGFIYSFLFTWLLAITVVAAIALACASPFDLLLSRIDGNGVFITTIHIVLLLEVILIIALALAMIIRRKKKR